MRLFRRSSTSFFKTLSPWRLEVITTPPRGSKGIYSEQNEELMESGNIYLEATIKQRNSDGTYTCLVDGEAIKTRFHKIRLKGDSERQLLSRLTHLMEFSSINFYEAPNTTTPKTPNPWQLPLRVSHLSDKV